MKIQKILYSIFLMFCMAIMTASVLPTNFRIAHADNTIVDLVPANYNFSDEGSMDSFTPFDFENAKRMDGKSWKPTFTETSETKYQKQYISFNEAVSFKLSDSIYFWIYFSAPAARPITFYLSNNDESNFIKWEFSADDISGTFQKTEGNASNYDRSVYLDNATGTVAFIPYGWNLVELKLSKNTELSGINQNNLSSGVEFIKFGFEQKMLEEDETFGEGEILFYNIYKDKSSNIDEALRVIEEQPNCVIKYKNIELSSKSYYAGEYYDEIPKFQDFFLYDKASSTYKGYLWIGKHNYLAKANGDEITANDVNYYQKYFDVEIFNLENNDKNISCDFGDGGITLSKGEYKLSVKFYPNYGITNDEQKISKSNLINLNSENYQSFKVSSYGSGIWFIGSSLKAVIGEEYEINYQIHSAFFEENFSNEVDVVIEDTSVIELVEHKKAERKIIVKCVGEGTSSIKLTLTSLRLVDRTNISELTNENYTVTATKPDDDPNKTTKIILWTSLGVVGGGSLIYLVYAFIKSRKIEVK